MSFWGVVFIVLMLMWLFGGCYMGYNGPGGPGPMIAGTIIPWACVAILGYIILGGASLAPMR
jgi:hypothetical protein